MKFELGPQISLSLRQELQFPENPFENPELYYQSHFHHKKNLLQIQFEYVIAPHATVNRFSQEAHGFNTSLGTSIEGKLFVIDGRVNGNQSQQQTNRFVQTPYAGLLLYLDNLNREELGKLIGEDKITGRTDDQIRFITYRAVLHNAEKILRSNDFIDFVERFRTEEQFPERVRIAVLKDLIKHKTNKVLQTHSFLPALSNDQKKSHIFYVEEQKSYTTAFQKNKYIQRSKRWKSFIQSNPHIDRLFGQDIIHSEGAAEDIINHPECQENMPQVIEFVDQMVHSLKTKDAINTNQLGGVILYLIQRHFTDTLDKKPSITPKFLLSLKNRLIGYLITEAEKMEQVLQQIPQLTTSIQSDEQFQQVVDHYLRSIAKPLEESNKQFFLIPITQMPDIITQHIKEYLFAIEDAIIGKNQDNKQLYKLLELRASTEKTGLPVDTIDAHIKAIVEKEHTVFQQKLGVPASSQLAAS